MKQIINTPSLKVYTHKTIGGSITIYRHANGDIMFGAKNAKVLNRFEKTRVYKKICEKIAT